MVRREECEEAEEGKERVEQRKRLLGQRDGVKEK